MICSWCGQKMRVAKIEIKEGNKSKKLTIGDLCISCKRIEYNQDFDRLRSKIQKKKHDQEQQKSYSNKIRIGFNVKEKECYECGSKKLKIRKIKNEKKYHYECLKCGEKWSK